MRYITFMILFCTAGLIYGQEKNTIPVRGTSQTTISLNDCDAIKEQVALEAANGRFKVIYYGIVAVNRKYEASFRAYMLKEYGIAHEDNGCMVSEKLLCEAQSSRIAIETYYGADFMNKQYSAYVATIEKQ